MLFLSFFSGCIYIIVMYILQQQRDDFHFLNFMILINLLFTNIIISKLKFILNKYAKKQINFLKGFQKCLDFFNSILVGLVYGSAILAMFYFQSTWKVS